MAWEPEPGEISDPFEPGDTVGRYRIRGLLGTGPVMAFYAAYDAILDREVALCTYADSPLSGTARSLELLERAAAFVAALTHPAIVPVLDGGMHAGRPYFIYQFMSRTLADELREKGALGRDECISIAKRVAGALDIIHRRGFVHRDVNPLDVFLNSFGDAFLGGLNFAHQANQPSLLPAIRLQYAAPEIVRAGIRKEELPSLRFNPTYDVWSLGVVMYECMFGERPYRTRDLREHYRKELPAPEKLLGVPVNAEDSLDGVILRCLNQNPNTRYRSGAEVHTALTKLSEDAAGSHTRVFISHSTADRALVEQLVVEPLERSQVETWYSRIAIRTAADWERSILEGLETSDWFLLVMSPSAQSSEWVKDELFWAIDNRPNRIIPVIISKCDPSAFHIRLRRTQPIDLTQEPSTGGARILDVVGR